MSVGIRKTILFMLWAVCISAFIGCGSVTTRNQNAMEISEDGKITASSYGSFDMEYYDAAELKQQVEAAIKEYNSSVGENRIELKKCSKERGSIHIVITYASCEDYTAFNGVTCYIGTLDTCFKDGMVDGSVRITSSDGSLKTTIGELNSKSGTEINILVIEEPMVVDVPGTVQYIGEEVEIGKNDICTTGVESQGDIVLDEPCYILFTDK